MLEFQLRVGNNQTDALDTVIILFAFAIVLQRVFFVLSIIFKVNWYIKNKNAPQPKEKHSKQPYRKGR